MLVECLSSLCIISIISVIIPHGVIIKLGEGLLFS